MTVAKMVDPYEINDKVIGDAIGRTEEGDTTVARDPWLNDVMDRIDKEARERAKVDPNGRYGRERQKASDDMTGIRERQKSRKTSRGDLERAREVNRINQAGRDRDALIDALDKARGSDRPTSKPRL